MKPQTFESLNLSKNTHQALEAMGFVKPSPIQSEAIPLILEGKDIVGQAQTGTGKTAAFGIPILEMMAEEESRKTSVLILCPTRELSLQVATELRNLAKFHRKFTIFAVYGGEPIQPQIKNLQRGAQIVVGTPGRIIDHIERKTITLSTIEMVVLDEADEMLNRGFREDIEYILKHTPDDRQTVLFSATMPKPILDIVNNYLINPVHVKTTGIELTATTIEQIYYDTHNDWKVKDIYNIIITDNIKTGLIFCNTKVKVDEIVDNFKALRLKVDALHGDLNQKQRNAVMEAFRKGEINFVIATDVAARGLDISHLDAVFNYDLPYDFEYYVHRIGRTGRAGKKGKAYSFVTGRNDLRQLKQIEHFSKSPIEKRVMPSVKDMIRISQLNFINNLKEIVENANITEYLDMVHELKREGIAIDTLAASLLSLNMPKNTPETYSHHERPVFSNTENKRSSSSSSSSSSYFDKKPFKKRFDDNPFAKDKERDNHFSKSKSFMPPKKSVSKRGK